MQSMPLTHMASRIYYLPTLSSAKHTHICLRA